MKLFCLSFLFSIFLFFNHATCLTPDQIKDGILNGTLTSIEAKDVNINLGEVECYTSLGTKKINSATPIVLAAISTKPIDQQSASYAQNKVYLIKDLLNKNANLLHQYTQERIGYAGSKTTENCLSSLRYKLNNYHQEITDWFIRNNKINDKVDQDENTLLHLLAQNDAFLEDIKQLLAQGAQVNAINKKGQTPLHIATQGINNDISPSPQAPIIARYFIDSTNIDLTKSYTCPSVRNPGHIETRTLLYRLLQRFRGDVFKENVKNWLVNTNNINAVFDEKNNTLFHHLADNDKNFEQVKWLIEKGANVEATNTDGQTPLHIALGKEHAGPQAQNIALEILHTTNVNLVKQHTFKYGQSFAEKEATESLFETAFKYKPTASIAINKILQSNQQGADLGGGNKLIHFLARSHFKFLSFYLNDSNTKVKLMPLINDKNNDGNTPLALACINRRIDNVQTLLGLTPKPQIDIVNKNNKTILYLAVYHTPILECLLKNSDARTLINKTDKTGNTPIQMVINDVTKAGHDPVRLTELSEVLKLLLEYGAKKDGLINQIKSTTSYKTWKTNFDKVIEVIENTNSKPTSSAGSTATGSGKPHSSSGAANPLAKKLSKLQKNLNSLRKKLTDLGHNLETLKAKVTTKATSTPKYEW